MKKFKKFIAVMLTLALVIPGIQLVAPQLQEVEAAEASTENSLKVKVQLKGQSAPYSLRLTTSLDSLDYKNAGFQILVDYDGDGEFDEDTEEYADWNTKKVVRRIDATTSKSGFTYNYSPKVIDTKSEYFVTGIMSNLGEEYKECDILVLPYYTPLDGNYADRVYGESRWFSIEDMIGENVEKNINIPILMDEETYNGVNIGSTTTIADQTAMVAKKYYDGEYAHFGLTVNDKTALPSASEVTLGNKTVIYRNLDSAYTGTKDTSFYTKYADNDAFIIASQADLYGLSGKGITADLTGKTIYLVSDIALNDVDKVDWTTGTADSGYTATAWEPIVNFKGTFDGQMHTISGLYQSNSYGMFKSTYETTTVKNFKLVDSYVGNTTTSFNDGVGSIVATTRGGRIDTVYSQATVNTTMKCVGGLVGIAFQNKTVINNCQYSGSLTSKYTSIATAGGLVGSNEAPLSIINSMFSGTMTVNSGGNNLAGGILGGMNCTYNTWSAVTTATVEIIGCMSAGTFVSQTANAVGTIVGQVVDITAAGSLLRNNVSCHVSLSAIGSGGKGTTVSVVNAVSTTDSTTLHGADGWATTLLNDDYFVAVTNDVPELKSFSTRKATELADVSAVQRIADTGWYNDTDSSFTIFTEEEFAGWIELSQKVGDTAGNYFSGKTITLGADLVLNEGDIPKMVKEETTPDKSYIPIYRFDGTFNGNGKTISGLYICEPDMTQVALFREIRGSVSDFRLVNSYVEGKEVVGGVISRAKGNVDSIFSDTEVVSHGVYNGGIVAQAWDSPITINNCWYDGKMDIQSSQMICSGGILGENRATTVYINNCLYSGYIETISDRVTLYIGGINGTTGVQNTGITNSSAKTFISGCISTGDFETKSTNNNCVAAILGGSWNDNNEDTTTAEISNCYALQEAWKYASSYIDGTASTEGITLFAAMKDNQLTGLDMTYWVYIQNGTPELRSFMQSREYVPENSQVEGDDIGYGDSLKPF